MSRTYCLYTNALKSGKDIRFDPSKIVFLFIKNLVKNVIKTINF